MKSKRETSATRFLLLMKPATNRFFAVSGPMLLIASISGLSLPALRTLRPRLSRSKSLTKVS
jgi:hypothetical protein